MRQGHISVDPASETFMYNEIPLVERTGVGRDGRHDRPFSPSPGRPSDPRPPMHDDPMNIPADSSLGPRVTYMYDAGPRTVGLATPASCRTNFPYDTMTGTLKQEVPRSAGTPRLSPSREQEFALEIRYHLA